MEAPAHTRRTQRHARRAYDDTHSHTITRHSQFTVSITPVTPFADTRHRVTSQRAVEERCRSGVESRRRRKEAGTSTCFIPMSIKWCVMARVKKGG